MRLGGEVVHLVGFDGVEETVEAAAVGHVPVVEEHARLGIMRVDIQMVDALGSEGRMPAAQAVHLVTLGQEQFGQVRTVLPGDSGDESTFAEHIASL